VSRIRQFRWDDYEAVVEVWRAAGIDVVGRAELEAKLTRDPELFLVAAPLPLRAGATSESHGPLARKETPAEPIPAGPTAAAEVVVPAGVLGIGGVVMGTYDGRRGWIFRLAVHPAYRRHGLATELVGELERRLQGLGCPRINLLVLPDNEAGLRFWQKLGYLPCPDVLCTKQLAGNPPS
jgi:ribosomal protein S18 acetylase RimI-like enzyme